MLLLVLLAACCAVGLAQERPDLSGWGSLLDDGRSHGCGGSCPMHPMCAEGTPVTFRACMWVAYANCAAGGAVDPKTQRRVCNPSTYSGSSGPAGCPDGPHFCDSPKAAPTDASTEAPTRGGYDNPPPTRGGYDNPPPTRGGYDAPTRRNDYESTPTPFTFGGQGYNVPRTRRSQGGYDQTPTPFTFGGQGYNAPRTRRSQGGYEQTPTPFTFGGQGYNAPRTRRSQGGYDQTPFTFGQGYNAPRTRRTVSFARRSDFDYAPTSRPQRGSYENLNFAPARKPRTRSPRPAGSLSYKVPSFRNDQPGGSYSARGFNYALSRKGPKVSYSGALKDAQKKRPRVATY